MKHLLFIYLLFLGFNLFSQQKEKEIFSQHNWSLSSYYVPQRTFLHNKDDANTGKELDYIPTYGYSYGFAISRFLSSNISIEVGIIRSVDGQKYKGEFEYEWLLDTPPYVSNRDTATYNAKAELTYVKFPFYLNHYILPHSRISFITQYGIQFVFLKKASLTADYKKYYTNRHQEQTDNAKEFLYTNSGISASLLVGTRIRLGDKTQLKVGITCAYSLFDAEQKDGIDRFWQFPIGEYINPIYFDSERYLERPETKNITCGLLLGIGFSFGKSSIVTEP